MRVPYRNGHSATWERAELGLTDYLRYPTYSWLRYFFCQRNHRNSNCLGNERVQTYFVFWPYQKEEQIS